MPLAPPIDFYQNNYACKDGNDFTCKLEQTSFKNTELRNGLCSLSQGGISDARVTPFFHYHYYYDCSRKSFNRGPVARLPRVSLCLPTPSPRLRKFH